MTSSASSSNTTQALVPSTQCLYLILDMTSSASSPNTTQALAPSTQSVRSKSDPTWDHCQLLQDAEGKRTIKCLYCSKFYKSGGIHRIKQHLVGEKGDVLPCLSVPFDVKHRLREHLNQVSGSRKRGTNQNQGEEDPYEENVVQREGNMIPPIPTTTKGKGTETSNKRSNNSINNFYAPRTTPGAQPSIRMGFADAIAAIGSSYKGPSYYAIRSNLLHEMKKEVELLVANFRNFWKETGCIIMTDGWQDQRNRQFINFPVYSPKGVTYVRPVDASDVIKDAKTLCNLFIELVEFVGVNNVVHLVTDNAANYKAAGAMLNEKFSSIYWSPCAAHCLNLTLGDFGKMDHVSTLAKSASDITKFVYNHGFLLAWLRKRRGWKEIIRPGATRFATTFIALKSIHKHKHDLQALVTSKDFIDSMIGKQTDLWRL
ncbi:PREDICTED: uncharacterized protein LOC109339956 [Lupinus angustifolius]|uniref:uncharacterized protein LOC109339956 n=1 Tax=Lupinus angustifolius TaxID=3871 RepID=UPI00092F8679|nr:PREDICTED: uncharacterized protein LOC109339956 [Lupinus angustifolius]